MLNIKRSSDDVKAQGDSLGGFQIFPSGAYEAIVKALYFGKYDSGAQYAGIHLSLDGKEYREQVYFATKDGDTFYTSKDGEKRETIGFALVNELCQLTTGLSLHDQVIEEKTLKLYDSTAKAETLQSVPVAVNVTDQSIIAGILHTIKNAQKKGADDKYVDINEKRDENTINKFFHAETQGTVTEYEKDLKLGSFYEAWTQKNEGNTINRFREIKEGSAPGRPGAAGNAGNAAGATKSLFNK